MLFCKTVKYVRGDLSFGLCWRATDATQLRTHEIVKLKDAEAVKKDEEIAQVKKQMHDLAENFGERSNGRSTLVNIGQLH